MDSESLLETTSNIESDLDESESFDSEYYSPKFEIISKNDTYNKYYQKKKLLDYKLTKFEKTKLLGIRAQMLAMGSVALVDLDKNISSVKDIANIEFKEKKIPLLIRRYFTNGDYEDWRLEELIA
uniref:Uncharacterized protein n=1 Tax=viral metagenome TaxID=1070528 RepID=A0A6C0IVK2_9ZZZZ